MSVNDLIAQGLFIEEPKYKQKYFRIKSKLPEEIKIKLEQYNEYKDLGVNKANYLCQMLIRIAFIRELHNYQNNKQISSIFHVFVQDEYKEAFKALILLIWSDINFSIDNFEALAKFRWLIKAIYKCPNTKILLAEDEKPYIILDRSSQKRDFILEKLISFENIDNLHKKCLSIWAYIDFLSNLLTESVFLDLEKNIVSIRENFRKSAVKIESLEVLNNFPCTNIFISINPIFDTKILTKSIAKIIYNEKQRLKKNAENRKKDILYDKEYDNFLNYNILLYMDIYLYAQVFDLNFSNDLLAKIVLNKMSISTVDINPIDSCRKYLQKFQKNIFNDNYISALQRKLKSELISIYVKTSDN